MSKLIKSSDERYFERVISKANKKDKEIVLEARRKGKTRLEIEQLLRKHSMENKIVLSAAAENELDIISRCAGVTPTQWLEGEIKEAFEGMKNMVSPQQNDHLDMFGPSNRRNRRAAQVLARASQPTPVPTPKILDLTEEEQKQEKECVRCHTKEGEFKKINIGGMTGIICKKCSEDSSENVYQAIG